MADSSTERNARFWRDKAEELRTKADQLRDVDARLILFGIAARYDTMAERVEARSGTPHPA